MAAAVRVAAAARSAVAATASGGVRRMFSIFADLDLKREPDLPPKVEPSTKLFVAGLNKQTTTERLGEAFSKFGQVVDAHVVTDRFSGFSKGFGFVHYATIEDAEAGKKGMDGKFLDGWVILADFAKPKPPARAATKNLQSPPSFQGASHGDAVGGNPQSPPSQSQPPPSSFQYQPSYHSPPFNERTSYNNVAPVNHQTPHSVQDINLNNVLAGNPQSPPSYQSQPSYHGPPFNQSPTSSHSPPSNEHYGYNNAAPMNRHNPLPRQDISLNNAMSGSPIPSFSSYPARPSYQHPPSNEHHNYSNATPMNQECPPSYQHDYNPVTGTPHPHTGYSNQAYVNPPQSATSFQHNSSNSVGSINPQSPPFYQHNTRNSMAPENRRSPPDECGNHEYQMPENPEAEPAYQYGR